MRPASLLALLLVAGLLTGCLRDPDPIDIDEDAVAVHGILEAGADSAVVLLSRPAPNEPYGLSWVPYRPITNAEVRLIAGTDTTWLVEDPDVPCVGGWFQEETAGNGVGCYRAILPEPIAAGAHYGLEIELPDGTAIRGETRVPEPVTLRAPDPGVTVMATCGSVETCWGESTTGPPYVIPVVTVPVAWTAPASVHAVRIGLRPVAVYLDGVEYAGELCSLGYYGSRVSGDSTTWRVPNISCDGGAEAELYVARFDSIRAELAVMGLNDQYTRYEDTASGQGVRVEAASQGLDGAYGVFGAVAVASRSVLIRRSP